MPDTAARSELEQVVGGNVKSGVDLARYTTIGCGGPASMMVEAESSEALAKVLQVADTHKLPCLVLGRGSNLLISDDGWQGLVIRLTGPLVKIRVEEDGLECGGGASLMAAARAAAGHGLSGLEPLAGIPGSVGGAVAMNAGAYGAAIGDLVERLEMCLPGEVSWLEKGSIDFGYRSSNLPAGSIVSMVRLALSPDDPEGIEQAMGRYQGRRQESQPRGKTCGSVFRNPEEESAGALLEKAGCKGLGIGAAAVSEKHANFIINQGGASAGDVLKLINECRRRVHEKFGIELDPEIKLVGNIDLDPLE